MKEILRKCFNASMLKIKKIESEVISMIVVAVLLSFLAISSIILELAIILGYTRFKMAFFIGGICMFVNTLLSINLRRSTIEYGSSISTSDIDWFGDLILRIGNIYLRTDFLICYVVVFLVLTAYAGWRVFGIKFA